MVIDPLVRELTTIVQAALADEATRRSESNAPALPTNAQRALALKVLGVELGRIDQERLRAGLARLDEEEERRVAAAVIAMSIGLGPIDVMLADPTIEEVAATRYDRIFTYHRNGRVELLDSSPWGNEAELADWLAFVARTKGRTERQFNAQHPLLVMRLGEGLRLAATRDVSQHVTFSLRRNVLSKVTLADLVGLEMMPPVLADLFTALVNASEMRWVVVGATSAGKTTLVRAMINELPPERRLVVIEDTAEIDAFDPVLHPNVESWELREANAEGQGEVTVGELVAHGLRYRPDLLTVGECRDSAAAVPMLKAMTHGQASVTTVHAHNARAGLDKLALFLGTGDDQIPLSAAHHQLSQAIDFVIHVDRGHDGRRFVSQVLEVAGFEGERCTANLIYEASQDSVSTSGRSMNRLTDTHIDKLQRAGFDAARLGGGFR